MKTFCTGIAVLLLAAGAVLAADTYGDGVSLDGVTPIASIVEDPDAWEGQEVCVEGEITGVCQKMGCWMELADADGVRVRVKVEDGVIVFPKDGVGDTAKAQGTVSVSEMSRDDYVGWLRHLAEEQGETFDESSVGDGPYRLVQIEGSGAEIGTK